MITGKLVLLLAIACVAEGGWQDEAEWAAVAHVFKKRAEFYGLDIETMITRYAQVHHADNRSPRAVMLRSLRLDARQPEYWSLSLRWSNYKPKWQRALEFSERFLRGEVDDPCPLAFHFGGPGDSVEGRALARVACRVPLRNFYYTQRLRPYGAVPAPLRD